MFLVDPQLTDGSNYGLSEFTGTEIDCKDMFDSTLLTLLPYLPIARTYVVRSMARRPDMISYVVYGTTDLYTHLMYYNSIISNEQLENGLILNCFSKKDLDTLIAQIRQRQQLLKPVGLSYQAGAPGITLDDMS